MSTQNIDAGLRVFVMGCSRGGTTLTQRLVAERLGLYTMPETRFFASLIGNLDARMFPNTQRPQSWPKWCSSRVRETLGLSTGMEYSYIDFLTVPQRRKWSSVRAISAEFVAVLDQEAKAQERTGWLEKTPFHVHYAGPIQKLIPDAWMIHIIRDPHETIASLWDVATKHPDRWGITYDRIERAVDNWNASITDSAAMVGQARQIFIPYSALTADHDAVMHEMARQMGFEGAGASAASASPQLANTHESWKAAALDGPVQAATSKWNTALSDTERTTAQALIRPIPAELVRSLAPFRELASPKS